MDLLISPPSFNPDEIITTSPHTLDQNDDLMSLSDIIENYRGEPGNEVVDLPEQVLEPLLLPNDQLDANRIDLPEHTSELPISPNTASNVDRPNLPECVPSSQSIPDVHTDIDPIPSTSSCPDLPVDDYPTFLKAMADKNNSFNTNIEEHNESLMKSSTKITLVPTSMDLDESNPYIQEILSDPETLSNQNIALQVLTKNPALLSYEILSDYYHDDMYMDRKLYLSEIVNMWSFGSIMQKLGTNERVAFSEQADPNRNKCRIHRTNM
ncbi:hypothetical protein K1T71_001484 [Dendrolimus kikuchii]|uniref:Uncharacterized protein n=1 Tax=Dendrolimus kikuchii TaxID=765133 RepID=A0ACC1DIM9_9NEOP|nr:hypothetical protein K1T71_001484 [Dendrolimus kikuchii]